MSWGVRGEQAQGTCGAGLGACRVLHGPSPTAAVGQGEEVGLGPLQPARGCLWGCPGCPWGSGWAERGPETTGVWGRVWGRLWGGRGHSSVR